jgi:hypothetical protein
VTQAGRFGPNTVAAERLLAALNRLGTPEAMALASAAGGNLEDHAARQTVRDALPIIARGAHRMDPIRAIGAEVERWATSVRHWFPAGVAGGSESRAEMEPRLSAVRAVLDAAYAVVLADQLRPDKIELLLGPWLDVVGDPFSDSFLEPLIRDAFDEGGADDEGEIDFSNAGDEPDGPEGPEGPVTDR